MDTSGFRRVALPPQTEEEALAKAYKWDRKQDVRKDPTQPVMSFSRKGSQRAGKLQEVYG